MNVLIHLEIPIGIIAGILIFSAQLVYLNGVIKSTVTPSVLSWLGWAILMLVSLVSQIVAEGWDWSQTGICISALGCSIIGITALLKSNYRIAKSDWLFLLLGIFCLLIYLSSNDPWLTTIFAIIADFAIGIPTIVKAYSNAKTERSPAWRLGLITWSLTLLISFHNGILYALFPIYLFMFSVMMVWLIYVRKSDI